MDKEKNPGYSCPVPYYGIHEGGKLTESERVRLESKLSRLLEWVGAWVPDNIVIDGKEMRLHDIIWDIVNKDVVTDSEKDLLVVLEEKLNKKFKEDLENIEHKDSTENQAIQDYCEALGLLRAIITLKDIVLKETKPESKDELSKKMRESTKDHAKYWLDFLKQLK